MMECIMIWDHKSYVMKPFSCLFRRHFQVSLELSISTFGFVCLFVWKDFLRLSSWTTKDCVAIHVHACMMGWMPVLLHASASLCACSDILVLLLQDTMTVIRCFSTCMLSSLFVPFFKKDDNKTMCMHVCCVCMLTYPRLCPWIVSH